MSFIFSNFACLLTLSLLYQGCEWVVVEADFIEEGKNRGVVDSKHWRKLAGCGRVAKASQDFHWSLQLGSLAACHLALFL